MRLTLAAAFLFTQALTACGDGGEITGDPEAGAALYASTCASCHAADGTGGIGPSLVDEVEIGDEADLEETIRNGAGTMPAFGTQLTDQEIADVIAFLIDEWG